MKIAIYGICKNEIRFVDRFATSIKNANLQPDGVYITDTGSTDGTQEALRKHGFTVFEAKIEPFRFDVARNISLDNVPKDIDVAFSVDLDDIFLPSWRETIEKYWTPETKAFNYPYINNWEPDGKTPQITIWGFKVHARDKFVWKYPMHELIFPVDGDRGGIFVINEHLIEHHPVEKDERISRTSIFERHAEEYKDDPLFNMNYARQLVFDKNYEKAVEVFKHFLSITDFYLIKKVDDGFASMQMRSEACRLIAECLVYLGEQDNNNIVSWYIKSVSESPYQREPWVYLAYAWFGIRDGVSALAAIEKAFMLNDRRHSLQVEDKCWDNRVFGFYDDIKKMFNEQNSYKNDIEGWMTPLELTALRNTALRMKKVVEIGSWKGRSTHALLSTCKGTVYAVDHWKGTVSDGDAHKEAFENPNKVFKQFKKNLKGFKNLRIIRKPSEKAYKCFKDKSVDMVFIDGEHTYEAAKRDIALWLPKATNIICGHDYNFSGVKQAVDEKFGTDIKVIGTIWTHKINKELP